MKELDLIIEEYFEKKKKLHNYLTNVEIQNLEDCVSNSSLLSLVKDITFEAKVFELLLHIDKTEAIRHLNMYYLEDSPYIKSRFKGNLDVMLDDYKNILGVENFNKLINSLSKESQEYHVIKDAIEFTNDD